MLHLQRVQVSMVLNSGFYAALTQSRFGIASVHKALLCGTHVLFSVCSPSTVLCVLPKYCSKAQLCCPANHELLQLTRCLLLLLQRSHCGCWIMLNQIRLQLLGCSHACGRLRYHMCGHLLPHNLHAANRRRPLDLGASAAEFAGPGAAFVAAALLHLPQVFRQ